MSFYVGGFLAYISGMCTYLMSGFGFSVLLSLCLLTLAAISVCMKRCKLKRLFYAVFFVLGITILSAVSEPAPTVFDNYTDRYVEVEGIICEMPDEYEEYSSYILEVNKLSYLGRAKRVDEKLRITCEEKLDMGSKVAFRGFINTISLPDNSTEFDYVTYYKSKDITYKMHAEEAAVLEERVFLWSVPYLTEYVKSRIGTAIDRFYTNDDAAMIKAVLLGNRSTFSEDFEQILTKTSALRFLYPSFLHIFLLTSLCQVLFSIVRPKYRKTLILLAMFLFVSVNSGFIAFVRAGILFTLDQAFRRKRGFSHYPDTASVTMLCLLIAEPLLIYNSGFVMSAAIGILLHFFRYPLGSCFKFIKNSKMRTMLAIWLIGTIGLAPLSAYYYNGMPIYSIIFTFVYTPFTILLLITSPIALLLQELFGTASIFGVIVDGIIAIMKNLPTMVSLLPGHYITLAKTSILGFAVWIIICYAIKLAIDERYKEPVFKVSVAAVLIILTTSGISKLLDFGKMQVIFPNVGQGDAAILDIKGKTTVLIDGGGGTGEEKYNVGEKVYLPYLTAKGYGKIDLAIVSHAHRDHAEGIIAAIEALDVHTVMVSDSAEEGEYKDKIIKAAEENGTEILYVSAGDRIEFNSGLAFDVIYPGQGAEVSDGNDYSLALKAEYKGTTMFFGGDITEQAEKEIEGKIGKVDIVKISHHGSNSSSREEFIKETSPKYAVASVGKNNPYGHPADRVVEGYTKAGAKILRTDLMNDIILQTDRKGHISAMWYGEVLRWR